jgi:uncharacterized membrane-anchored protein YitT (DUF2179 family)
MAMSVKMQASARQDNVELTEREKWRLSIGLGAIACGLFLAVGTGLYLFGAEATVDGTGIVVLGAFVYSYKAFWASQ